MKNPEQAQSIGLIPPTHRRPNGPSAIPQSIDEQPDICSGGEIFASFEQCMVDAKRKTRKKSINEDNPLGKWIAFVKAKNKKTQKRKETKRALKVASYNYYDARSPSGNISHFLSGRPSETSEISGASETSATISVEITQDLKENRFTIHN